MARLARVGSRKRPAGFTLVEALAAISVSSIACTAVLLSMTGGLTQSADQVARNRAVRLAESMLDEISSKRFIDPGPSPRFGIESDEQAADPQQQTRVPFDDIDDFDGWERQPPQTPDGLPVGVNLDGTADERGESQYASFRRRVSVEYVRLDDHKTPAPVAWEPDLDPLAAHVTVQIEYKGRLLCTLHKLLTFDEQF